MTTPAAPTVFISSSRVDAGWKALLLKQLYVLREEGLINIWEDRHVEPGADWHRDIQEAIKSASAAVLIITANFLTSEYILNVEVPALLGRRKADGLPIFPLIAEPCAWEKVAWLREMNLCTLAGRPLSAGDGNQINDYLAALAPRILEAARAASGPENPPRGDVEVSHLPITVGELFGRDRELMALDRAWENRATNVMTLVAWAGVGKSALVNRWLARMARENYRGAARVYGWSFYDPGRAGSAASADQFVEEALAWFGDPRPGRGTPWAKGERLAGLVARQRTLLVLDGLEPLQSPPGPDEGRLKDQALQALLRSLVASNEGLCVVTTRIAVHDLRSFEGGTHVRIDLEHLSSEDGAQLLRGLGVKGADDEVRRASEEFGGHPLALALLGSFLGDVYGGDVTRRREVRSLEEDVRHGGHAKRVMESYVKWLGEGPELAVLHLLGLFNRPADRQAVAALRAAPPVRGLTNKLFYSGPWNWLAASLGLRKRHRPLSEQHWRQALGKLRRARLLAEAKPEQPGLLDTHPLVREHFGWRLKLKRPAAWREGHARLFKHLRDGVKGKFPENTEEAGRLYAAVTHGCHAGRHKSAFDWVYYRRIQRAQRFFSANRIAGSVSADLDALSCFFPNGWDEPVTDLKYPLRALLLGQAGYRLWMLGQLKESIIPMQRALAADVGAAKKAREGRARWEAWKYASVDADTLAGIHLGLGYLSESLKYSEQAVGYARDSSDVHQVVSALNTRGDVQHHRGEWAAAEKTFLEAEDIKKNQPPDPETKRGRKKTARSFHNALGYRYCDLLLSLGRYPEALERLGPILKSQEEQPTNFNLIDIALSRLLLGRVQLAQVARGGAKDLNLVKDTLDQAMSYLLHAGRVVHFPRGLMALAEWHLINGTLGDALTNLEEAHDIAGRGQMRLHQADCLLKSARVYLAQGNEENARESWETARAMIELMGYRRRDKEIDELGRQLNGRRGERA